MSAFFGGGFASGFTSGLGATSQFLGALQEARDRREAMAMRREEAERRREDMDRLYGLKERELGLRERQFDLLNQLQKDEAEQKREKWSFDKHLLQQQQAKAALSDWYQMARAAQEAGDELPPLTKEARGALEQRFGSGFLANPTGRASELSTTLQGIASGQLPLTDPAVGRSLEHIAPWVSKRGIGERLASPVEDGINPTVPAGAEIVAKRPIALADMTGKGDQLVPLLEVTARKGDQEFKYVAPLTEGGTADSKDRVVTLHSDELRKAAEAQIGAASDPILLRALQRLRIEEQMSPEYQKALQEGQKAALERRVKEAGIEKDYATAAEHRASAARQMKEAEMMGKDKGAISDESAYKSITSVFGESPEIAKRFLLNRFAVTGVRPEDVGDEATLPQTAVSLAAQDISEARSLNRDLPTKTILDFVLGGTFTRGIAYNRVAYGYKVPDPQGGPGAYKFLPVRLTDEVPGERDKEVLKRALSSLLPPTREGGGGALPGFLARDVNRGIASRYGVPAQGGALPLR